MNTGQLVGLVASRQYDDGLFVELVTRYLLARSDSVSEFSSGELKAIWEFAKGSGDPRVFVVVYELAFHLGYVEIENDFERYLDSLAATSCDFRETKERGVFFYELIRVGIEPAAVECRTLANMSRQELVRFLAVVPEAPDWLKLHSSPLLDDVVVEGLQRHKESIFKLAFVLVHDFSTERYPLFAELVGRPSLEGAIRKWSVWGESNIQPHVSAGVVSAKESDALIDFGSWLDSFVSTLTDKKWRQIERLWSNSEECQEHRHRLARRLFGSEL